MVKKSKFSKISILTKVEKKIDDYPDSIKIDTLVDDSEENIEKESYFLMTETGEEIKGNYSHIIKLYNLLGGTIIKESDYPDYVKPVATKNNDVYKVFQEHFYTQNLE